MTDKTSEALELAEIFERGPYRAANEDNFQANSRRLATDKRAAALLRRQHQRIEALREALARISRISADGLTGMQDAIDRIEAASGIASSILSTTQQEDSQA